MYSDEQIGRCCVSCSSPILYTEATASTPNLFYPLPPPRTPLPLPCRVLQRGESSQGICLSLAEPPDYASLSLEYAASFCPHCTSFRKEKMKGGLTLYTNVINKYILCAETVVFTQQYASSTEIFSKSGESPILKVLPLSEIKLYLHYKQA